MGCAGSKEPRAKQKRAAKYEVPSEEQAQAARANIKSGPPRPRLDPKDFRFIGLEGVTAVKAPGSINGQAFIIDKCRDCDLYVLDNTASVTIDECINCRIFIGPTDGSIFLRDSSNIKAAFVTRQLRLRDVKNTSISLLCRTRPIIETSSTIRFGCFDWAYPGISGQLKAAKLDPLQNFWWHVYDFTPNPSFANWSLLGPGITTQQLLGPVPAEALSAVGGAEARDEQAGLVRSQGPQQEGGKQGGSYSFVMFQGPAVLHDFLAQAAASGQVSVLRTNRLSLGGDMGGQVASAAGWGSAVGKTIAQGSWCGAEVVGPGSLPALATQLGGHACANKAAGELFINHGIEG